jgi:hypothetical protein
MKTNHTSMFIYYCYYKIHFHSYISTCYTYQWVTPDVATNFVIPKCGKWYFRLFTNVCRYDYCGSACGVFVEGND